VRTSIAVLLTLIFSKFVYLASFSNYYTFYLMHRFDVSVKSAQMHLFAFSAAVAVGTLAGGPLGDRIGRKHIIWFSILGALPITVALPYANLFWTGALSLVIGFVLASAFPAIVVYGQELIPGRVGMVAGLFFGLSFGAAGLGAAMLGALADATSIEHVYRVVAFLPALGVLAALLPSLGGGYASAHLVEGAPGQG
jgi:MFS transporter, FSR family, fosmidomycin resistance protein